MAKALEIEIDANFDYFQRHISKFVEDNYGKFALLKSGRIVDFYESLFEAEKKGENEFPDGIFSIQEVTNEPVDLGFFTHASDNRDA